MVINVVNASGLIAADESGGFVRLDEELVLHLLTQVRESGHILIVHLLQHEVAFVVLLQVFV